MGAWLLLSLASMGNWGCRPVTRAAPGKPQGSKSDAAVVRRARTAKPAASIDFSSVALAGPLQVPASSVLMLA
jgi:hypothetical protein